MIKLIIHFLSLVLLSGTLLAQNIKPDDFRKLSDRVIEAKSKASSNILTVDNLLTPVNTNSLKKNKTMVKSAEFFNLNIDIIKKLKNNQHQFITLTLPYEHSKHSNFILDLYAVQQLYKHTIHAKKKSNETSLHLRGVVRGFEDESLVALSIFDEEIMGIVSIINHGNYQIGKMTTDNYHVIYNDKDVNTELGFNCLADDLPEIRTSKIKRQTEKSSKNLSDASNISVGIFFVVDYDIYSNFNLNETTTENFVEGLFNQVATIYENDGMTLKISDIEVIKTPDSYGTNPLDDFIDDYQGFKGDVAHLISFQSSLANTGGRAYIDVLCLPSLAFGESRIKFEYQGFPNSFFPVINISHEIGHNIGSDHTSKCIWNGNNTQIDDCRNVAYTTDNKDNDNDGLVDELDEAEGSSCFSPQNPILPSQNQGTLMSLCQLIQNVGINLASGFGPQPAELMREAILDAVPCLTEPFPLGDVNLDGIVNILDAYKVANYAVLNITTNDCQSPVPLDAICTYAADVDLDGNVTINDAYVISRCAVGLSGHSCSQ